MRPQTIEPRLEQRSADHALAQRCAEGDSAAHRELFREHRDRVHGILFRILGSNSELEDLVQDSFLEIFRSLSRFRGDSTLATWIARITTRVAFAHIRRRPRSSVPLESVAEIATDEATAEAQVAAREATRRLYAVLDKVEPKQRIAYALHVIDGRSMREVAEMTDATVVATKSRVWRARREISRRVKRDSILAEYLRDEEDVS
jgi:RNA polymerase sigma-70 factor (ECF subfamily)